MVNISRSFLTSLRRTTSHCTNPNVIYEAMKQTFKASLEYKRSIHVKNLYQELKKDGIGTTKIENMCSRLCNTLPKHRERTLVKVITNWKLHDAHKELRKWKIRNTETWRKQRETIAAAGVIDQYERLWRREITKYENNLTSIRKKKLQHLKMKYKRKETNVPDEIEGIILKDQELPVEYNSTPRTYGGVILDENEQSLLTLPPKYAMYERVTLERCEAEIEKALAKLRWEQREDSDRGGNELPRAERKWHNLQTKTIDLREYRSTELPFNGRIYPPQPLDNETESCLQNLKVKLNECTKRYVKENTMSINLTEEQQGGLSSLKEKKKDRAIVIFETDKSKRFACDTVENYTRLGAAHIANDDVVGEGTIKQFEKEINAHAEMLTRIFSMGVKTGNHDRIRASMKSRNNPAAPLSILRKDHKPADDEEIGPPGRPVCGGDVSYNKGLSHLISTILAAVYTEEETVCASTE